MHALRRPFYPEVRRRAFRFPFAPATIAGKYLALLQQLLSITWHVIKKIALRKPCAFISDTSKSCKLLPVFLCSSSETFTNKHSLL